MIDAVFRALVILAVPFCMWHVVKAALGWAPSRNALHWAWRHRWRCWAWWLAALGLPFAAWGGWRWVMDFSGRAGLLTVTWIAAHFFAPVVGLLLGGLIDAFVRSRQSKSREIATR